MGVSARFKREKTVGVVLCFFFASPETKSNACTRKPMHQNVVSFDAAAHVDVFLFCFVYSYRIAILDRQGRRRRI